MAKSTFEKTIERATGESVETLRTTPIEERRAKVEAARGKPMEFYSAFPVIGRGHVLRENFVTHEGCELILDGILGKRATSHVQ